MEEKKFRQLPSPTRLMIHVKRWGATYIYRMNISVQVLVYILQLSNNPLILLFLLIFTNTTLLETTVTSHLLNEGHTKILGKWKLELVRSWYPTPRGPLPSKFVIPDCVSICLLFKVAAWGPIILQMHRSLFLNWIGFGCWILLNDSIIIIFFNPSQAQAVGT